MITLLKNVRKNLETLNARTFSHTCIRGILSSHMTLQAVFFKFPIMYEENFPKSLYQCTIALEAAVNGCAVTADEGRRGRLLRVLTAHLVRQVS
jgi:hypothetical protein